MSGLLNMKCEKCHKSYFANSPVDPKDLDEEQILNLFKFQVDEDKHLACPACISDQIEIDPEL